MRKLTLVAVSVAALLSMLALPAFAAVINGTLGDDVLIGTPESDDISGVKGNDIIEGRGAGDYKLNGNSGDDEVYGNNGEDYIVGGYNTDFLSGGPDNDILIDDGDNLFVDVLACGDGAADTAYADPQDEVRSSCEIVNPPYDPPIR